MQTKEKNIEKELVENLQLIRAWGEIYGEMLKRVEYYEEKLKNIFKILKKGKELKIENILIENFLKAIKDKIDPITVEYYESLEKDKLEIKEYEQITPIKELIKIEYKLKEVELSLINNKKEIINNISLKFSLKEVLQLKELSELEFNNNCDTKYINSGNNIKLIKKLTNLEKLHLTFLNGGIKNLDELEELKELNLKTKKIENLRLLKNIENLFLSLDNARELPEGIENLTKLRLLSITGIEEIIFDKRLTKLINLIEIEIEKANILNFGNEIENSNIEVLSLKDVKKLKFNSVESNCGNLKKLELNSVGLECNELIKLIIKTNNLQELLVDIKEYENNDLKILYENISKLEKLKKLAIKNFNLKLDKKCEEYLENLKSLESLELNVTEDGELPNFVCKLVTLKEFHLSCTMYRYSHELPECFINLKNLEELSMDDLYRKEIPLVITKLKNLRKLFIGSEQYLYPMKFPEEIKELRFLEEIKIWQDGQWLTEIICSLKNLKKLEIKSKGLGKIRDYISKLENIEEIILKDGKITEISQEIYKLKKLKKIEFEPAKRLLEKYEKENHRKIIDEINEELDNQLPLYKDIKNHIRNLIENKSTIINRDMPAIDKIKRCMLVIEIKTVNIYVNSIINEVVHISNKIEEESKRYSENIVDFELKKKVHYREIDYRKISRKYLQKTTRKIIKDLLRDREIIKGLDFPKEILLEYLNWNYNGL